MSKQARERLVAYRDKHFKNDYELADLLHVGRPYLSQLLSGQRNPGLAMAVRIEDATGIPARAWADIRKPKSKTRNKIERESAAVA
jgi:transcriptional regulator with XRE-family HTH domain